MSRPRNWDPLRPSDPVGGDPDAIAVLAQRYTATAQAITAAAAALREIHDSATVWHSDAGRAFRDRATEVGDTIGRAHDRYARTAEALAAYGRTLHGIQAEADLVLARATRARDARDAAQRARERNAALPEPDPAADSRAADDAAAATAGIHAADRDLRELEDEWRSAGDRAAAAIEEVNGGDPLEDGVWDDALDLLQTVTEWAGTLSALFGVIALALSVIPGGQPLAAVFGALALLSGAVSLAGSAVLAVDGRATPEDVLWNAVGVISFGAGRAFALAGRAVTTGTRGLARPSSIRYLRSTGLSRREARAAVRRHDVPAGGPAGSALAFRARSSTGWLPTRGEWADAYRPSTLFRNPVTGPAPVVHPSTRAAPDVAAGLRRAALAGRGSTVATGAGSVADVRALDERGHGREPRPPAGRTGP